MHNQLKSIAAELNTLAEKLEQQTEPNCCETAHSTECEATEPCTCEKETATCSHTHAQTTCTHKGPNLQMPFKLPGLNMFGGNMFGSLFGGLPNLNNLPKTLAELQQNPQLMQMLQNLPNNPQMLDAVSRVGGVDKEQILSALAGLNTDAAPAATQTIAMPDLPKGTPFWQPETLSLKRGAAKGDPLERLLTRWHWRY